jgi:hypothetical protein
MAVLGDRSPSVQDGADPLVDAQSMGRPEVVEVSGRARQLWEALSDIDEQLGHMYLGALDVLQHHANPDRLALVAHGVRELIEKLPRFLDVPSTENRGPGIREQARSLVAAWEKWGPSVVDGGGMLTSFGEKLLGKLADFCEGVGGDPTRRQAATAAISRLDLNPLKLPPPIQDLHIAEWSEIEGFFIGVAHHTRPTDNEELEQYLAALERFLLDRLRPRTFEDFAAIDELLGKDEL